MKALSLAFPTTFSIFTALAHLGRAGERGQAEN